MRISTDMLTSAQTHSTTPPGLTAHLRAKHGQPPPPCTSNVYYTVLVPMHRPTSRPRTRAAGPTCSACAPSQQSFCS